jgi:hypothetical protein
LLMISAVLMFAPALFMIWAAMIMIFLDSDDYEPPLIYHPIYYRKKY